MHIGTDGEVTSACSTLTAALQKQGPHCGYCDLEGLVMIYHREYTGLPTRAVINHNGQEIQVRACYAAHCSCEVGKWMRSCTDKDLLKLIPPLAMVGQGVLKGFSPTDPTLDDVDELQEPDWKGVQAWLAEQNRSISRPIPRPKYDGNRDQARREMEIARVNAAAAEKAVSTMAQREPGED